MADKYSIDVFDKKSLDLTMIDNLREVLNKTRYDFVISPAISLNSLNDNILIVENLLALKGLYDRLIVFSSGATSNRKMDIVNLKEGEFHDPPTDVYGLSKYVSHQRVIGHPKVINLRIFNMFGIFEKPSRFISTCIRKYLAKDPIEIWGDATFDFFGENDFITVITELIETNLNDYFELNLVYPQKRTLFEIADTINKLGGHKVDIKIKGSSNRNYFGCGDKLHRMNIPLLGIESEIKSMYKKIIANE